ncbi:hypothetical protein BDFB_008295, partial [Asbolus verrucosus]
LVSKWNDRVVISVVYNCTEPLQSEKERRAKKYDDYDPDYDLNPLPIFILRKCKHSSSPCRIFIDHTGRVYGTWDEYLTKNKLPKCNMILPKNGRYNADSNGDVLIERHQSPACDINRKILQGHSQCSRWGGLRRSFRRCCYSCNNCSSSSLNSCGHCWAYSIGRSIYTLRDRSKHKETLSFANSEARGAYLNIVAGSLGFAGAGAGMAVSQLAARGVNIGVVCIAAFNAVNIANLSASGISVANSGYDVLDQWINEQQAPSLLTIVQLSSSILFFGHAVYSFKTAGTLIKESRANAIKDFHDSLRSNRHRRMFNKLMKETIRQNDGNVAKGQAEVIRTIRNINNKDQVFATLTRWNKLMNENKVRFAVKNGDITLNGKVVDMGQFAVMERNEVATFLTRLPNTPKPTEANVRTVNSMITNSFRNTNLVEVGKLTFGILQILGNTDLIMTEKIISAVASVINALTGNPVGYLKVLDEIFPNHAKYFKLINMVTGHFQKLVNVVEEKYKQWLATKDPSYEEPYFIRLSLDAAERAVEIFNIVTKVYFMGTTLTEHGLKMLLTSFTEWFTRQVYIYQENQQRKADRIEHNQNVRALKIRCSHCGGYYYERTKQ